MRPTRREAIAGAALLVAACGGAQHKKDDDDDDDDEGEVTANEDLMREHGALRRILLIYGSGKADDAAITACAKLVRTFVEDYHERLEEQYIFPRLEKGPLQSLVATLRLQHAAGRRLTDQILANPKDTAALAAFGKMYPPHAAFEDTVLFPAWKQAVGKKEYGELGEKFEDEETKQLGKQGFEHVLAQIAEIEKAAGIGDLAIYTPS